MSHLKKLLLLALGGLLALPMLAQGLSTYQVIQGGTGSTTLSGIIYGNGTSSVRSVIIGSNLTFSGGTLSATGGSQTPWTSAIDGAGYALTNAGNITATYFTATSTTATSTFKGLSFTSATGTNAVFTGSSTFAWLNSASSSIGTLMLTNALAGTSGGTGLSTTASSSVLFGNNANGYVMMATNTIFAAGTNGNVLAYLNGSWQPTATTTFAATSPITVAQTGNIITYACPTCGSGGGTDPFSHTTNFGVPVSSTDTPVWFTGTAGVYASGTSQLTGLKFANATGSTLYLTGSTTVGDGSTTGGLTVNGTATTTGVANFSSNQFNINSSGGISKIGNTSVNMTGAFLQMSNSGGQVLLQNNNATANSGIDIKAGSSPAAITFYTNGAEQGRFGHLGNFAIGSTTPYARLSVSNTMATTAPMFVIASSSPGSVATSTYFSINGLGGLTMLNGTSSNFAVTALGQSNCDVLADTSGNFYCGTNGGASVTDFFTHPTNYGVVMSATSNPMSFTGNLFANIATIGTTSAYATLGAQGIYGSQTPLFDVASSTASTYSTSSLFRINARGDVAIGTTTWNSTYPEKLIIDLGNGNTTENAVGAYGNVNDFIQYNIQNKSAGANAEAGYTVTNNVGNQTSNFIYMGANNSTFWNPQAYTVGGPFDTNVLSLAGDMYIANGTTTSKNMYLLTGGVSTSTNIRMSILGTGNVGIGTTTPYAALSVNGQIVGGYITATSTSNSSSLQGLTYINATGTSISTSGSSTIGWLNSASSSITKLQLANLGACNSATQKPIVDATGAWTCGTDTSAASSPNATSTYDWVIYTLGSKIGVWNSLTQSLATTSNDFDDAGNYIVNAATSTYPARTVIKIMPGTYQVNASTSIDGRGVGFSSAKFFWYGSGTSTTLVVNNNTSAFDLRNRARVHFENIGFDLSGGADAFYASTTSATPAVSSIVESEFFGIKAISSAINHTGWVFNFKDDFRTHIMDLAAKNVGNCFSSQNNFANSQFINGDLQIDGFNFCELNNPNAGVNNGGRVVSLYGVSGLVNQVVINNMNGITNTNNSTMFYLNHVSRVMINDNNSEQFATTSDVINSNNVHMKTSKYITPFTSLANTTVISTDANTYNSSFSLGEIELSAATYVFRDANTIATTRPNLLQGVDGGELQLSDNGGSVLWSTTTTSIVRDIHDNLAGTNNYLKNVKIGGGSLYMDLQNNIGTLLRYSGGAFRWLVAGVEKMTLTSAGLLGVGTTTPAASISVTGVAGTIPFLISTTTATLASSTGFMIDTAMDLHLGGGTPVLSGCGTTPSLGANSTDQAGTITAGATATGCTITFAAVKKSVPHCVVSSQTMSLVNALSYTESTSALVLTQTAMTGNFDYVCFLGH